MTEGIITTHTLTPASTSGPSQPGRYVRKTANPGRHRNHPGGGVCLTAWFIIEG
jgi:hypothetical protein